MPNLARLRSQLAQRIAETPLERGFCAASITQHPEQWSRATPCAAAFPSALALTSLQQSREPATARIQTRMAEALWTQKQPNGAFNYWQRGSGNSTREPYPDDLDTTSCALAALAAAAPERITGSLLASITMLLLSVETKTGGPYRTWLVPPHADTAWKDVDPAVNANIGRFLHGQGVHLPGLSQYLHNTAIRGQAQSPYYPSPIATYYFLSSWWKKEEATHAIAHIHAQQQKNGSWGTPLETAWALTTLLRWEGRSSHVERGMDWLGSRPQKILTRPYALCTHAIAANHRAYLGAPMVTLAACLEAITAYEGLTASVDTTRHSVQQSNNAFAVFEAINARLAALPHPLRAAVQPQLDQFRASKEGHDIAQLPTLFVRTLPKHIQQRIPNSLRVTLGAINLYGWIAYTVYDNILDHESGAQTLPVANFCLRELTAQYTALSHRAPQTRVLFNRIMDNIDAANAWEVAFWRRSSPRPHAAHKHHLAHRSLGHALGPLTILAMAGRNPEHPEFQALEAFFTHYLIARQIDDDAHDWEEDLARGQLNSVSVDLLNARYPAPSGSLTPLRIPHDLPALRAFFWEQRAEKICTQIIEHTHRAEQHLQTLSIVQNPAPLLALLAPIRASARRALAERQKTLAFLNTYQSPAKKSTAQTPPPLTRPH